ncbi:hypothetical protein [Aequorivita xiaoshiensis]|uniref:Uncharacterized protein n=1 Tax=Aequorivita xiaoshiensis TaxID=2874476 RepID=A0A9X1R2H1_9FLAO|nr:hypothetical protein [Aequorivita xiaoshiensis]MCG2431930.1 hypothetical protein [Aequorivita xiaoshiensis]
MNTINVKLTNSKISQPIDVVVATIEKDFIDVSEIVTQNRFPYLLCLPAESVVALLDFTNVSPYEIWYFDDEFKFSGKGFSLISGKGSFRIQTRAKYIVLWNLKSQYYNKHAPKKCNEVSLII